jgi:hypothetical protein
MEALVRLRRRLVLIHIWGIRTGLTQGPWIWQPPPDGTSSWSDMTGPPYLGWLDTKSVM